MTRIERKAEISKYLCRWGQVVQLIAVVWFAIVISTWMKRQVAVDVVFLLGVLPSALYWAVGYAVSVAARDAKLPCVPLRKRSW